MILVHTSVWIDDLHQTEPRLVSWLERDEVGCHPAVVEELALGRVARREHVLSLLAGLQQFPVLDHREVLTLVNERRLWGRGLSATDAHLLGAAALVGGGLLWTRAKRLLAACRDVEVGYVEELAG